MDPRRLVKVSKFLSKHLRHEPDALGLTLEPGGWVTIDDLLAACANHHSPLTRDELVEVVNRNDKQRFSFDPSHTRIRANQGHSTPVDLQLEPLSPPEVLYHGTAESFVAIILDEGLSRMSRHHVHLSVSVPTAEKVGARRGKPVVLIVDAAAMSRAGHQFYCSANGVWLTEEVPPQYLRPLGTTRQERP
jgi:putative RNA 2'-phosphotransferase